MVHMKKDNMDIPQDNSGTDEQIEQHKKQKEK
jgi:hypothetical protein